MEQFWEENVARKNRAIGNIVFWVLSIGMVLFGFLALLGISNLFSGNITLETVLYTLIVVGFTLYCYFMRDNLRVEYDYIYTAGELDFDRIIANKKRKHIITLQVRDIIRVAPIEDSSYESVRRQPDIRKINLSFDSGEVRHYLYYIKNGSKGVIVFEPSRELLMLIQKSVGKDKVGIDERVKPRSRGEGRRWAEEGAEE